MIKIKKKTKSEFDFLTSRPLLIVATPIMGGKRFPSTDVTVELKELAGGGYELLATDNIIVYREVGPNYPPTVEVKFLDYGKSVTLYSKVPKTKVSEGSFVALCYSKGQAVITKWSSE